MTTRSDPRPKPIDIEAIRGYFSDPKTVDHYVRAIGNIGLWNTERAVFEKKIERQSRVLDLGCGAGRIAIGLWELGYRNVAGADLSEEMIAKSRAISHVLGVEIPFFVEDATNLSFEDQAFDAIVFGFTGLMQIPGWESRRQALKEIWRVLAPKGTFIFTTLDREDSLYSMVFSDQDNIEHDIARNSSLIEEGDRLFKTEHGTTFMHVPTRPEVEKELQSTGFDVVDCRMRNEIGREPERVLEFSEDCRFWVTKKLTSKNGDA